MCAGGIPGTSCLPKSRGSPATLRSERIRLRSAERSQAAPAALPGLLVNATNRAYEAGRAPGTARVTTGLGRLVGGLLAGAQRGEGHRGDRVGSQLAQGALLTGGPGTGGDRVQGRVQQESVHGGQQQPDPADALARRPRARHTTLDDAGSGAFGVTVGVNLHQGPLNVPSHLGHAAPGCLGQDLLLNR